MYLAKRKGRDRVVSFGRASADAGGPSGRTSGEQSDRHRGATACGRRPRPASVLPIPANSSDPALASGRIAVRIGELLSVRQPPPPLPYARRTSERRRLAPPRRSGGGARRQPQHAAPLERLRQADLLPQPRRASSLQTRRRRDAAARRGRGHPGRGVCRDRVPRSAPPSVGDEHGGATRSGPRGGRGRRGDRVPASRCPRETTRSPSSPRAAVPVSTRHPKRSLASEAGSPTVRKVLQTGRRLVIADLGSDEPAGAVGGGDAPPARRRRRPRRAPCGRWPEQRGARARGIESAARLHRRQRDLRRVHGPPGGSAALATTRRLPRTTSWAAPCPTASSPNERQADRARPQDLLLPLAAPAAPRAARRRLRHPPLRPRGRDPRAGGRVGVRRCSAVARPAPPRDGLRPGRRRTHVRRSRC